MEKNNKKRNTGCPVAYALDVFGDRWSLLVIRDILIKGYTTYSELLNSEERIATNILASRLKQLEAADIITKAINPENKRQNIYQVTKMGIELTPIIIEMMRWSAKYDNCTKVSKELLLKIETDREGFIQDIQNKALLRNL